MEFAGFRDRKSIRLLVGESGTGVNLRPVIKSLTSLIFRHERLFKRCINLIAFLHTHERKAVMAPYQHVGPSTTAALTLQDGLTDIYRSKAREFVASLFQIDGRVRFKTFPELHAYIVSQHGFTFLSAEKLGDQDFQLFYRFGEYLWIRAKDAKRFSCPSAAGHMAATLAVGKDFKDELCKVSRTGNFAPKLQPVSRPGSTKDGLADRGDWRNMVRIAKNFPASTQQAEIAQKAGKPAPSPLMLFDDSFAGDCHFDLRDDFDWNGVEKFFQ